MAITIRLTEEQENTIEKLKRRLNQKSSSKALLEAAELALKLQDELWHKDIVLDNLKEEIRNLKTGIVDYHETKERLLIMANK